MPDKKNNIRVPLLPIDGSIGVKIKLIRMIRGLTQKELGIKCGFPEKSADNRIRQYELGDNIPQKNTLNKISEALGIKVESLYNADFLSLEKMGYALFDMEELHGLHPVKTDDGIFLKFSGYTKRGKIVKSAYDSFLNDWYNAYMKYKPNAYDSDDEKKVKHDKYILWKYNYTFNAQSSNSKDDTNPELNRLQAEYDKLYSETNSKTELNRIDSVLENELSKAKSKYEDIKSMGSFWNQIILLISLGATIEHQSPESPLLIDSTRRHVISIKSNEITNDCIFLTEIAQLFCEIDTLNKKGIDINREITSFKKELFLTFKVSTEKYYYFTFLDEHWDKIELLRDSIYNPTQPVEFTSSLTKIINDAIKNKDIFI